MQFLSISLSLGGQVSKQVLRAADGKNEVLLKDQ